MNGWSLPMRLVSPRFIVSLMFRFVGHNFGRFHLFPLVSLNGILQVLCTIVRHLSVVVWTRPIL